MRRATCWTTCRARAAVAARPLGRVAGNRLLMWQDLRSSTTHGGTSRRRQGGQPDAALHLRCRQPALGREDRGPTRHGSRRRSSTTRLAGGSARRTSPTERPGAAGLEQTRRFVWQGLRMVQELRDAGRSSYVYSPDSPYTPMARVDAYSGAGVPEGADREAEVTDPALPYRSGGGTAGSHRQRGRACLGGGLFGLGEGGCRTHDQQPGSNNRCVIRGSTRTNPPGFTTTRSGTTIPSSGVSSARIRSGLRVGTIFMGMCPIPRGGWIRWGGMMYLADTDLVCRGGTCTFETVQNWFWRDHRMVTGRLLGVSTQARPGGRIGMSWHSHSETVRLGLQRSATSEGWGQDNA